MFFKSNFQTLMNFYCTIEVPYQTMVAGFQGTPSEQPKSEFFFEYLNFTKSYIYFCNGLL